MSTKYAQFKFAHSIDIDDRTCDFVVTARVRLSSPIRVELVEIDLLDYSVTVYGLSGLVKYGTYDDSEAPKAEDLYWNAAIKVELETEIFKRGTEFNWQDDEGDL